MGDINYIQQFMNELSNMDIANFIFVALLFSVPFYFSKKAESLFFHSFYSLMGIYMLFTMDDPRVIYDLKMLVGLGLVIPQIRFIVQFTKETIFTIKMMTANTYYFFVTLYYKVLRFINWIRSVYVMIQSFFKGFEAKSRADSRDKKEEYQESNNQQTYEDYKQEQKQKDFSQQRSYEEPKQEQKTYTKQDDEYARFYSQSVYTVLGVNADDDYNTVKKAYRKLVREFHPDLHPENIEKFTEITQNINNAWEKVSSWKK